MENLPEPVTLQEAVLYFSSWERSRDYLIARRWPDGIVCPRCGGLGVKYQPQHDRWQCASHHDSRQFTLKTGTIFEDSAIALNKWLLAMWMVVNCRNGVSSYEIARAIKVTQKTAWFMDHRIRKALQDRRGKLSGTVEMDETFIGGKVENMHKSKKPKGKGFSGVPVGAMAKTIVVGMLERSGRVRAEVVVERTRSVLHEIAKRHIADGSTLMTDEWGGYKGVDFEHHIINHAEAYVRENVHTQGIENFWSLLKRILNGTYISVEPFHLFRYIDEQAFRFNHRGIKTDGERFSAAVSQIVGKRLTYDELTGKEAL